MQHELARLPELRLPDDQQARGPVEVAAIEPDGLTHAHAAHREQADERRVGRRAERPGQGPRRSKEAAQVGFGVKVGRGPVPARGK